VIWTDVPKSRQSEDEIEGQELLPLLPVPYLPHPGGTTAHLVFRTADGVKGAEEMRVGERIWDGSGGDEELVGLESKFSFHLLLVAQTNPGRLRMETRCSNLAPRRSRTPRLSKRLARVPRIPHPLPATLCPRATKPN
jgi:hypothetical protein